MDDNFIEIGIYIFIIRILLYILHNCLQFVIKLDSSFI